MRIVVIGGTGLIGSKTVQQLKQQGHEAVAAAPNTGVNTLTGEGLASALKGAEVVIDVSNSPSFEERAATEFFEDIRPEPVRSGGQRRRPPPRRALGRWDRPIARQRLLPSQGAQEN